MSSWYKVAHLVQHTLVQVDREIANDTDGTKEKPDNAFYLLNYTARSLVEQSHPAAMSSVNRSPMVSCIITFDGYQGAPWQALLDDNLSEDSSAQQHNTPAPVQQARNYSTPE